MENLLLSVIVILMVIVVKADRHHPKFPRSPKNVLKDNQEIGCTRESEKLRHELIEAAQCGPPKDQFYEFVDIPSYEEIYPSAVWVKRCIGLCDHVGVNFRCSPIETKVRHIPVKIFSLKTRTERCATRRVVDHVTCGCQCSLTPKECGEEKEVDSRKCSCQCKNSEERRSCLRQRNHLNVRWNRSKCRCERRRKT